MRSGQSHPLKTSQHMSIGTLQLYLMTKYLQRGNTTTTTKLYPPN